MYRFLALPVALLATYATAQTSTTCDPTKKTCPNDPALGTTFETTFNSSMVEFDPNFFNLTAGTDLVSFSDNGAEMSIVKQGDSVTVETAFYIMFGTMEIIFQAASGQGIISTVVFLSDDLDEIDIEIMGGNTTHLSNNFYGQGNTDQFNSEYPAVGWDGGAMGGMHNYTVNWSQDQIEWIMDGKTVRTQPYLPPGQYPQTPCYIKFGLWAGGDPSNPKGTIQWAGGPTDYSDG
jgi:beta-glucanase (GH16 family)